MAGQGRGALPRRAKIVTLVLCVVTLLSFLTVGLGSMSSAEPTYNSASTAQASWNPNVSCSASLVTIPNILGSACPSQSLSGSSYQTSSTSGGTPNKRAMSPPCSITNTNGQSVSTFVQVSNVTLHNYFYEARDCATSYNTVNGGAPFPSGEIFCDSTGNVFAVGTSSGYVHIEFDRDWMAKGWAGPTTAYDNNNTIAQVRPPCTISSPCTSSVLIDVQGFVYWDPEGHWELHPFTAWKLSSSPPPQPPPLSTSFTYSPSSPWAGASISFSATASGGTAPYGFNWNFGDGSTGTRSPVTHVYQSAGSYAMVLTTTDSGGQTASTSRMISVTSGPGLSTTWSYAPSDPTTGTSVSFNASASGGTPPYSFGWRFGDGGTATGASVAHSYHTNGTYTVTLTVLDASNRVQNVSKTLNVVAPLTTSFKYSPSSPSPLENVTFTALATGGTQPYTYAWNFGDGATSTGSSVSHSYLLPGSYTVTLTVNDAKDRTASFSQTVTVALSLLH